MVFFPRTHIGNLFEIYGVSLLPPMLVLLHWITKMQYYFTASGIIRIIPEANSYYISCGQVKACDLAKDRCPGITQETGV
jgi:hypothetical protein